MSDEKPAKEPKPPQEPLKQPPKQPPDIALFTPLAPRGPDFVNKMEVPPQNK